MSAHLTAGDIEHYRRGEAPPARLLALDEHLAGCEACRSRVEGASELASSLRAGVLEEADGWEDHLTFEELSAYADDTLDDVAREIAETHLAACDDCRAEAQDLVEFRKAAAPHFAEEYGPQPATPAAPQVLPFRRARVAPSPRAAWWAAAAAALLLVSALTWLAWRSFSSSSDELARTPPATPAPVQTPAPQPDANPTPAQGDAGATPEAEVVATPPPAEAAATPSPEVLVALEDAGGRVTLDAEGRLEGAGALTPAQAEAVRTALRTRRAVNPSALAGLGGRAGVLMSGESSGEGFGVRGPVGAVVETPRPTLRWDALEGATEYRVNVYDSNFNLVADSPPLRAGRWTPDRALPRGAVYSWQVTALKDGREVKSPRPPAPEARFRVLDANTAAELERLRRAAPRSRLALGVLYARAGLLEEAERELSALLRSNPRSEVARKLLQDVRAAGK